MPKIELLVPAGSMDAFKAAIINGADAIYLGGKNFGARAYADNFSHDELIEAIKLAHLHNVKVYVTMNTMLYEDEINSALNEAKFLYEIGVDALIIQDLGLVSECRKRFPNLELHASTQMHIHNLASANFIVQQGVKRVVMARESSLDTVKEVTKAGIEVEVFAHGALCISYSGQCLMSSALFSRSGNKGTCAQCCRLQYKLYDKDNDAYIESKNEYLLSPKDLNLLEKLPELIKANISSIKIEGRMKRPEYVGLITRIYRMAIDAYYNQEEFKVNNEMLDAIKVMFNRGFTYGHLFNLDSNDIYNQSRPNHLGIEIGKVIDYKNKQVMIKLSKELNQGDGLRIIYRNDEYGIIANKIYKNGLLVNGAKANEVVAFDFNKYIAKDALVLKTTDVKLNKEINELNYYRKSPIDIYYEALIDKPFKIIISKDDIKIEVLSDFIMQKALKVPLSKDKIDELLSRINDSPFKIRQLDGKLDEVFAPIKVINETRRIAIDKLANILANNKKEVIINDCYNLDNNYHIINQDIIEIQNEKHYELLKDLDNYLFMTNNFDLAIKYHLYYLEPNVNEDSIYQDYDLVVASELGGINKAKIVASNLNIANSYALEFILNQDIEAVILSTELNDYQIERLVSEYYKRYQKNPNIYRYMYGKRDLMYLKKSFINHDINQNINEQHNYDLVDTKGRHFNVYKDQNNLTHILEDETKFNSYCQNVKNYIRITDETNDEIRKLKSILTQTI